MKRKIIALLCALGLLITPVLAAENPYLDVPEGEWYTDIVLEVTEKGLMIGVEEGYFGPEEGVTRAMVVTVLWRMEGCPEPESPESFLDIDPEDTELFWYAPQVAWAKENGVINGYDDGTFQGENFVTREELAALLYLYAQYKGEPLAKGSLGLFDDAYLVSEWAMDAVRHAVGMGLIQGDEFGHIDPQGLTTRAALATILHRMMIPAAG